MKKASKMNTDLVNQGKKQSEPVKKDQQQHALQPPP